MKKYLVIAVLAAIGLAGCTAQEISSNTEGVIKALLNVAQAEEVNLTPADSSVLTPWVNLGFSLNTQLVSCTSTVGSSKAKALACFNAFTGGLLSSTELAQLRILSPAVQAKVQLIVTAVVVGVNVAVTSFGSAPVPTPSVGPAPTAAQLSELRAQIGY